MFAALAFIFESSLVISNAQDEPATRNPPAIVRTPLLTAVINGNKTVQRVEIKRIEFRPSQSTGVHLHPSPVVGLVIEGSVFFQIGLPSTQPDRRNVGSIGRFVRLQRTS